MDERSCLLIDALGGTSEVAKLIRTPMTTVHAWRKTGIPEPRFDHICLAATARGKADILGSALTAIGFSDDHGAPSAPETSGSTSGTDAKLAAPVTGWDRLDAEMSHG